MLHAHYVSTIGVKRLHCAQIRRCRSENHVARVDEHASAHIDALLRRRRDLNSLNVDTIAFGNGGTQFGHALSGAVLKHAAAIFVDCFGYGLLYGFGGESVGRGVATGKGVDGVEVDTLENLSHRRAEKRANVERKPMLIIYVHNNS